MATIIASIESYLPSKVVTNDDLSKIVETSHEWIYERTGIEKRHIVEDEDGADLGCQAAEKALAAAGILASDIDAIVVTTCTAKIRVPPCACKIQGKLGATRAFAFDINASCAGFIYGLSVADGIMRSMRLKNVLLISVDTLSLFVDWTDRNTCVLFGDGAGAVVLQNSEMLSIGVDKKDSSILAIKLYANGELEKYEYIMTHNSAHNDHRGYIAMSGSHVFKHAIDGMAEAIGGILKENNMTLDDIDWIVPHQANKRIIESMCKLKNFPMEKVILTIHDHANTSSASIPLAISAAIADKRIKKGDVLLLVAFGAGFVYGAAIVKI